MVVAIITQQKAEEIQGIEYADGVKFNPQEINGKWFISLTEAQYLTTEDIVELWDYVQPEMDLETI